MTILNDDEEILDLVDANDHVIGQVTHDAVYGGLGLHGGYVRAASCFLQNSQGQLWIPRRLTTKKIAPGGLDFSAGGHVQAGESYDDAMVREIAEEVGLHVSAEQLVLIGKQVPVDTPPHYYFSHIYLYFTDVTPVFSPDDFSGFEWLSVSELQARLAAGEPSKLSLPNALQMVSAYMAEHQRDN